MPDRARRSYPTPEPPANASWPGAHPDHQGPAISSAGRLEAGPLSAPSRQARRGMGSPHSGADPGTHALTPVPDPMMRSVSTPEQARRVQGL